ncbi:MAG: hypothetical protein KVP17_004615 [Porospora cf. gigantea B]|uniref:uncharacterized protein n=1 Tax=Porospora cf. gigantea B TaxID=2853592 RepID=UPI003571A71F|nr:MAG: hypothetical protein KVP17_004615 [Porospora cf. gigantea B]
MEKEDSKTRRERNARNRAQRRAEALRPYTGSPPWSPARRPGRKRQRYPGCPCLAYLLECCDSSPEPPYHANVSPGAAAPVTYLRAATRRTPCPEPPFRARETAGQSGALSREQRELEDLTSLFFAPDWEEGPPMSCPILLSPSPAANPPKNRATPLNLH